MVVVVELWDDNIRGGLMILLCPALALVFRLRPQRVLSSNFG